MTTNYVSAVRLTQLLEPVIRGNRDPAFIVTTSGVALVPDVQDPTYSATKAALHSLCLSMRFVLARGGSSVQVFEFMAPLTDSPSRRRSPYKAVPAEVVAQMLDLFAHDVHEMHVGDVDELYRTYLPSAGRHDNRQRRNRRLTAATRRGPRAAIMSRWSSWRA